MARKSGVIGILQVDEGLLSVVRIKPTPSGLHVLGHEREVGRWSLGDGSLEAALRSFSKAHRLEELRLFTVAPRHEVTARIMEMPSQDPEEIRGMVQLSAEDLVPYAADDIVYDYAILAMREEGNADVLVVVAHRDFINGHIELLQKARLEPERVLLSTACLISVVAACMNTMETPFALANLASGGFELLVLDEGEVVYGRGAPLLSQWSDSDGEGAAALEELASEVKSSLSAYKREARGETTPDTVYLCSDWADVEGLSGALGGILGRPCAAARQGLEMVNPGGEVVQGVPLVALGAGLAAQGRASCAVDLTPGTLRDKRAMRSLQLKVLQVIVILAVAVGALAGAFFHTAYQRQNYIAVLERSVDEIRPRVRNLMTKRKHLDRLRTQVTRNDTAIEVLATVSALLPKEGMNITRFAYRRETEAIIQGRAKELRSVEALADDLRATGELLSKARQMYTSLTRERGKDVWAFSISIPLRQQGAEGEDG